MNRSSPPSKTIVDGLVVAVVVVGVVAGLDPREDGAGRGGGRQGGDGGVRAELEARLGEAGGEVGELAEGGALQRLAAVVVVERVLLGLFAGGHGDVVDVAGKVLP